MKTKRLLIIALAASLAGAALAQQTDAPHPQRLRVAQDVMFSLLTHGVPPEYPEEARAHNIVGKVVIKLEIDKEGHVVQADVLSGHPLFVQPAIDAVRQWQFKPYLLNGEPVAVETTANLGFGPPQMMRVSQGVSDGNILRKVDPVYPAEAKAKHIRGDVILQVTISKDGKVTDLKPVQGDALLAQAAIEAVQQWQYKPYLLNGNPVEIQTTIKIHFHM